MHRRLKERTPKGTRMCEIPGRPQRQLPGLLPVSSNRAGEKLAGEPESGFPAATKDVTGGSFFSRLIGYLHFLFAPFLTTTSRRKQRASELIPVAFVRRPML